MNISAFQPFTKQELSLSRQCIDIWRFSLRQVFNEAPSILNQEEMGRAGRFYFPKHRRRFIAARVMLRLILARYVKLDAAQLEFVFNEHGKPDLAHIPFIQFNLSHSADLALLAVGKEFPLGIDLEFFSARPYEGIGSHLFSEQENQTLKSLQPALKPLCFFHIWTQKEAFIKACGLGLSYPTRKITVPALPPADNLIIDPLTKTTWKITSFVPQISCCAALCYNPEINSFRHFEIKDVTNLLTE
ncbi:4'-phosphopantetheinyl transferase family protein [Legionella londiniensis]|nr:4'-phosphopantetheinyl transferase superfamily protein [Legionella londiniensis]